MKQMCLKYSLTVVRVHQETWISIAEEGIKGLSKILCAYLKGK